VTAVRFPWLSYSKVVTFPRGSVTLVTVLKVGSYVNVRGGVTGSVTGGVTCVTLPVASYW
jgi:hypothetical protein